MRNTQEQRWKSLLTVLDDHTEWFHSVIQNLFYYDAKDKLMAVVKPASFAEWLEDARNQDNIQEELLDHLRDLHRDMFKASDVLLHDAKTLRLKPEFEAYQAFMTFYEEFLQRVRRLERDFLIDGSGYDSFTGLRSPKVLVKDIERELHRLSRRGKSFCLAMAKIDEFEAIQRSYSEKACDSYVKLVADLIKLSIRSFDDAYYLGQDEFVLCLKQADIAGGISALERLRKELERQKITLDIDGRKAPFSMSCCIAAPVQGDDVEELIKNLRIDLNAKDRKSDTLLEYYEMSPLQRYVHETGHR